MRVSEKIAQGAVLPRGSWHGVDPRTQVVPAKKGRKAPYRRQPRRKQDAALRSQDGGRAGGPSGSIKHCASPSVVLASVFI